MNACGQSGCRHQQPLPTIACQGRSGAKAWTATEAAEGFHTPFSRHVQGCRQPPDKTQNAIPNPSHTSASRRQAPQMHFLDLPRELRLRIYSELLVQHGPVEFGADYCHRSPSLVRVGKSDLHPSLLRVSRMVKEETASLLYSKNCFRFPDAHSSSYDSEAPFVEPFLGQVGHNARFLRHICINFPSSFTTIAGRGPALRDEHCQLFRILKETCTNLRTLEIVSEPPNSILSLYDVGRAAKMLRALDEGGLNGILSLERILLIYGEYDMDDEFISLRESLVQVVPSRKWSVELAQVREEQWISYDGRVKFKNSQDCRRYNKQEATRLGMETDEREVQLHREDEYWLQRKNSYWKNVSIGFNLNNTNDLFGDCFVQSSKD